MRLKTASRGGDAGGAVAGDRGGEGALRLHAGIGARSGSWSAATRAAGKGDGGARVSSGRTAAATAEDLRARGAEDLRARGPERLRAWVCGVRSRCGVRGARGSGRKDERFWWSLQKISPISILGGAYGHNHHL
jgi:hypothetical protein